MSRLLAYVVLTICVAVWLGNLMVKDPGYVLLSYDGTSLQTSVWVFLGASVFLLLIILGLWRLVRVMLSSGGVWGNWLARQRLSRAHNQTSRGVISLIEGHWRRAQDYLLRGVDDSGLPLVNYLGAARAAQEQGDIEKRDELIRLAQERVDGSELAIGISLARFQIDIEAWDQAVATLSQLPGNALVLELLVKVYIELNDWPACKELLSQLKKNLAKERFSELEELIWRSLFNQIVADDNAMDEKALEQVRLTWKEVPAGLRKDSDMLIAYASRLVTAGASVEAAEIVRKALKSQWQEPLVDYFGTLAVPDTGNQIKTAETWLQQNPDNPRVLLCLGRLYAQSGDYERARNCLEKSMSIRRDREVCIMLGRVFAKLGDHMRSNQLYLMAMGEEESAAST
jgi:HemY protein